MHPPLATGGGLLRARLSAAFDEAAFRAEVARSNADPIPRPLALTVQIPATAAGARQRGGYIERLMREIEQVARLFDRDRDVLALHFDGGAGVAPRAHEIETLVGSLERHFHFGPQPRRDFSIRVEPDSLRAGDIAACASIGFHCADIDAGTGDLAATLRAVELARREGMRSTCVEWPLREGRPPQALLDARPDRLACILPDGFSSLATLQPVATALAEADYTDIGLDPRLLPWIDPAGVAQLGGIARDGRCLKPGEEVDLIGLGAGAVSRVRDSVCQNHPDLEAWEATLDLAGLPVWRGLTLGADERRRTDVIGELLRTGEIAIDAFERRHAVDFAEVFERELAALEALPGDLFSHGAHAIRATSQGRLMLRIMAACFENPGQRPPQ
jgi:oxygen-independent coproporphyrinogen-3 oxidase